MSHNQISGAGIWNDSSVGVLNTVLKATGSRKAHDFHCAIPPLYVLSDGTVLPVVHVILKPVYRMLSMETPKSYGQPLGRISIVTLPNGLLLTENPAYLRKYPGLLFPGKDDKTKNPRKVRARVSFEIIRQIAGWRFTEIDFSQKG